MNKNHHRLIFIHCTETFKRRLSIIRKTGALGASTVRKAERIIDRFTYGFERGNRIAQFPHRTKHGELRIKKCEKYDLGGGYRLIAFRRNHILHIAYMGTHDECSRWVEHHRDLSEVPIKTGEILTALNVQRKSPSPESWQCSAPQDTPDEVLSIIGDRELRIIFKGLVEARLSMRSRKCQSNNATHMLSIERRRTS